MELAVAWDEQIDKREQNSADSTEGQTWCGEWRPLDCRGNLWNVPSRSLSSQCSVTCGKGYRQRLVSCSEIYTGKENYEYSYQSTVNCPGTQPPSVHPCYLRDCPVSATWRVGNWGSVSRGLALSTLKSQTVSEPSCLLTTCHG